MARKHPNAPLTLTEQWALDKANPLTIDIIAHRIAEGQTLKQICVSAGWPKSYVWKWINDDPALLAAYNAALQSWADELAQDTIQIADGASPEDVALARLQIDTRLKVAAKWDRQRYGEAPQVNITAQSGSLVSILSALPALRAPEEEAQAVTIDVTPKRVQPEKVVPMELRDKTDDAAK